MRKYNRFSECPFMSRWWLADERNMPTESKSTHEAQEIDSFSNQNINQTPNTYQND